MSLKDIRYIIFDLNGTLTIEDYLRHDEVFEKILGCKRRNRALTLDDMREVSKGAHSLSEIIARVYQVADPIFVSEQFIQVQASRILFQKKAVDVLQVLKRRYKLILCSDTTGIAKEVVKNLNLSKFFIKIFYSCDVGYLKSEEMFWGYLQSYFPDAKPQEFLAIGDNARADIYHPNRLGMWTVQIENSLPQPFDYREGSTGSEEEKADHNIQSLDELLVLLRTS
ncbi:HAD family hydrolase [Candidatus Bathyarchaeota archaeon]|nr:HAD family hydrolase [Candidatus Bathyarchaeota archaeon]